MNSVLHIRSCFLVMSLLATAPWSQAEEGMFTQVRITDLGFGFEVPSDWYALDATTAQKLDKALNVVLGGLERPQRVVSLVSQQDVHSTTSSALTVLFQPDASISQQQLATLPPSALEGILDKIRDDAVGSMKQIALSARVARERLVKRTNAAVFLGVELVVKMRSDIPEKRKEVYYMFSDKGIVLFSFTYLDSDAVEVSGLRDHILESFKSLPPQ